MKTLMIRLLLLLALLTIGMAGYADLADAQSVQCWWFPWPYNNYGMCCILPNGPCSSFGPI